MLLVTKGCDLADRGDPRRCAMLSTRYEPREVVCSICERAHVKTMTPTSDKPSRPWSTISMIPNSLCAKCSARALNVNERDGEDCFCDPCTCQLRQAPPCCCALASNKNMAAVDAEDACSIVSTCQLRQAPPSLLCSCNKKHGSCDLKMHALQQA